VDCARKIDGRANVAAAAVILNTAFRRVTGRVIIRIIRTKGCGGILAPPQPSSQAKVMFWSRSGTERMRLPVAAK
jgi:hypothetical protein